MKNLFAACVAVGLSAVAALAAPSAEVRLSGAGATFPAPLYAKWVSEFQKVHPEVKIDYQSIGSGGGVKAITEKTVAFGASDAPLSEKEIEAMGGTSAVIQFPTVAGAVVPAYNVRGVTKPLNFTGEVLANIFMGKISWWSDKAIADLNPGVALPDTAITPATRTDGSGTTYVFTNYLATQSNDFTTTVGTGKQVKWPVGQGGKGNEGVAAIVQQTPGSIGYIEVNYANANKIPYGNVKNKAGKFVKATRESVSAAGEDPADTLKGQILKANIQNQPGDNAYPISAFTYIIIYSDLSNLKTAHEAKALTSFLNWALDGGQKFASEMDYAPLSPKVKDAATKALGMASFKGK